MAEQAKLFHESWYRVAEQRISLRPNVVVERQVLRGEKWYVVQNPLSNQFYRLNPGTYDFVARLSSSRTVEEVWKETQDRDPDNAPGQGDVIELLAQLYHANLLHYNLPPNSEKLFERYKQKKQRILKAGLKSIMFFRIPLFDPDALLQRLMPVIRLLISPLGAVLWCIVVVVGAKIAIDNFGELRVQSQGIMAPSNLLFLYLGLVIVKTLHEFGHAFAVRRFGGEVHIMGVMFLIFSPLPYMDATAAWSFRNKWQRVFVGAAGMVFEVFVAACALFVWANTGSGVVHSLAYNMVFVASVTTVLFNINPLLRFDGYYILSDLLDLPNLHQHSAQHLKYLVEHHAFGSKSAETTAVTRREEIWFTAFGILSGIYRIFVFSAILLFVADQFLLAGMIMALICVVSWVVVPIVGIVRYLGGSPRLYRTRSRAIAVCGAAFAVVFALLFLVPFPNSFKAPGVLKATDYVVAVNRASGQVEEVLVISGQRVNIGDPLLRLSNTELALEIKESRAGLDEAKAQHRRAMRTQQADLDPIAGRIAFYEERLRRLTQEQEDLVVKSEAMGLWVAPNMEDRVGMWISRGSTLGELINDAQFHFVSVVSQTDVSDLFAQGIRSAEVKLEGQADVPVAVTQYATIPMEQTNLPSLALGYAGGGDIAIDTRDGQGVKTSEPYYQVRADVQSNPEVSLLHGRSGRIRFVLEPKSLASQGWREVRQLVQKRYQL
ncbi:MAG: putative peptide zinc metalloprotease protein [Candidatus Latescibacterota bacterium]|jgi:putative peptide zinc metalloprotease protein